MSKGKNENYEKLRESSTSSLQDLVQNNVKMHQEFNQWFRPKATYVTEYQERYQPHSSPAGTVAKKKRTEYTPVGDINRGKRPDNSKKPPDVRRHISPPPKISETNQPPVSKNVKFAWPGSSDDTKSNQQEKKGSKLSQKSKTSTSQKKESQQQQDENITTIEKVTKKTDASLVTKNTNEYASFDEERNKTQSEYKEKYHPWEINDKALPFRPQATNPIGSSVDAIPSSEWKSFAKQNMEEVAQAMKGHPPTEIIDPHRNIPEAPSNYAWPQYRTGNNRPTGVRPRKTEHHEKYKAWEVEKTSPARPPSSNPITSSGSGSSSSSSSSGEAIPSSEWKSHTKEVMEKTEQIRWEFEKNQLPPAGVRVVQDKAIPGTYVWQSQQSHNEEDENEDNENEDNERGTRQRKLTYQDVHTEYRDNYLKWAVERATKQNHRPTTNPMVAHTNTDTDPNKSETDEWLSESQRARIESLKASQSHSSHDSFIAGVHTTKSDQSPPNFAWNVPEVPRHVADYKDVHTEYRDSYHQWDTSTSSKSFRPATSNPIVTDPPDTQKDPYLWKSETQRAKLQAEESLKAHDNTAHVAGVPSSSSSSSSHTANTSSTNFIWPIEERPRHVADYQNVHTEYRDNFHEWECEKSTLQRPPSSNPICSNNNPNCEPSQWESETKHPLTTEKKKLSTSPHDSSVAAGVMSVEGDHPPPNFSWPVPVIPRHKADYKNVHTEYRDHFLGKNTEKATLLRPTSSNPISGEITDSSSWITETHETMRNISELPHSPKDYLLAGAPSSSSSLPSSSLTPPNFAWPIPELTKPRLEFKNNVHTEYRDNFQERVGDTSQFRQSFRPKDHNPILGDNELEAWQSEYQGTIGTNTSTSRQSAMREGTRNEFASKPEILYWTTAAANENKSVVKGDVQEKENSSSKNGNDQTMDSLMSTDSLGEFSQQNLSKSINQNFASTPLSSQGKKKTKFVGTTEYQDQFKSIGNASYKTERSHPVPKTISPYYTATETIHDDPHSSSEEIEHKTSIDEPSTTHSKSSQPLPSSSSSSSLAYSGARKTHISVLPPQLKFYGTSEYKDQFTNKGVISTDYTHHDRQNYEMENNSLSPSHSHSHSHLNSIEKKLTTKKFKEQSLTEHKSRFTWPTHYLYHQHQNPSNRSSELSLTSSSSLGSGLGPQERSTGAGDLITPTLSSNQKIETGHEEMKSIENTTSRHVRENERMRSDLRDEMRRGEEKRQSHPTETNQKRRENEGEKWTPTKDLHLNSPIEKLGLRQTHEGVVSNREARSHSAPIRRFSKSQQFHRESSNPILANRRFPSSATASHWTTETRDSFNWKKK